ncbi:hypothetical protein [Desulfocurvibacter africanus]|uniref:Uncharacterized protein n=1 Tax=Desulfocurvibacter africanus subsp. africanus str. Walvis Bay TaxID=690850 RepID=F3YVZ3_DESAF|nr:hypothetical protein [Desulfocurvibacter africanus]EGJ49023.1 hypothetical protein Desaf_0671 [Desulfocurvibacter africanus subsp. africanus str. Walvis Bay]
MPKMSKREIKQQAREQALCDAWNASHPVGTAVSVLRDKGSTAQTRTVSEAQVLNGHTAVIWLEGISGCYELERVTAIE